MAKLFRSCAELAIGLSQRPHLAATGLIASLAVLWVAPELRFNAVVGAEAATVAAAMVVAAIAAVLAAADWLTENASRRVWASAGMTPADLSAVPAVPEPDHSEGSYAPAASEKALWALLRVHRREACPSPLGAAGNVRPNASLRTNSSQPKRTEESLGSANTWRPGSPGRQTPATSRCVLAPYRTGLGRPFIPKRRSVWRTRA
jgi:hypothetical protein